MRGLFACDGEPLRQCALALNRCLGIGQGGLQGSCPPLRLAGVSLPGLLLPLAQEVLCQSNQVLSRRAPLGMAVVLPVVNGVGHADKIHIALKIPVAC